MVITNVCKCCGHTTTYNMTNDWLIDVGGTIGRDNAIELFRKNSVKEYCSENCRKLQNRRDKILKILNR